jgi:hypothetical protein
MGRRVIGASARFLFSREGSTFPPATEEQDDCSNSKNDKIPTMPLMDIAVKNGKDADAC